MASKCRAICLAVFAALLAVAFAAAEVDETLETYVVEEPRQPKWLRYCGGVVFLGVFAVNPSNGEMMMKFGTITNHHASQ